MAVNSQSSPRPEKFIASGGRSVQSKKIFYFAKFHTGIKSEYRTDDSAIHFRIEDPDIQTGLNSAAQRATRNW
jgi:hypothetical protein